MLGRISGKCNVDGKTTGAYEEMYMIVNYINKGMGFIYEPRYWNKLTSFFNSNEVDAMYYVFRVLNFITTSDGDNDSSARSLVLYNTLLKIINSSKWTYIYETEARVYTHLQDDLLFNGQIMLSDCVDLEGVDITDRVTPKAVDLHEIMSKKPKRLKSFDVAGIENTLLISQISTVLINDIISHANKTMDLDTLNNFQSFKVLYATLANELGIGAYVNDVLYGTYNTEYTEYLKLKSDIKACLSETNNIYNEYMKYKAQLRELSKKEASIIKMVKDNKHLDKQELLAVKSAIERIREITSQKKELVLTSKEKISKMENDRIACCDSLREKQKEFVETFIPKEIAKTLVQVTKSLENALVVSEIGNPKIPCSYDKNYLSQVKHLVKHLTSDSFFDKPNYDFDYDRFYNTVVYFLQVLYTIDYNLYFLVSSSKALEILQQEILPLSEEGLFTFYNRIDENELPIRSYRIFDGYVGFPYKYMIGIKTEGDAPLTPNDENFLSKAVMASLRNHIVYDSSQTQSIHGCNGGMSLFLPVVYINDIYFRLYSENNLSSSLFEQYFESDGEESDMSLFLEQSVRSRFDEDTITKIPFYNDLVSVRNLFYGSLELGQPLIQQNKANGSILIGSNLSKDNKDQFALLTVGNKILKNNQKESAEELTYRLKINKSFLDKLLQVKTFKIKEDGLYVTNQVGQVIHVWNYLTDSAHDPVDGNKYNITESNVVELSQLN